MGSDYTCPRCDNAGEHNGHTCGCVHGESLFMKQMQERVEENSKKPHFPGCKAERDYKEECFCELIKRARNGHDQVCPKCYEKWPGQVEYLTTLSNTPGGGSHYWHLYCEFCEEHYTYSNYDNELVKWNE